MRLQLALNVKNLDSSIDFYSKLFNTAPYKIKPGYANWEIANPPLKLVLFESATESDGSINHLGVETETAEEVVEAHDRLDATGLNPTKVEEIECCYADKVETWVNAPDTNRWEWYLKAADVEDPKSACCA